MKPVDARRKLVAKFLQTTGPVILTEVCDRFGWTEPVVKEILDGLVREGTVAKGEFLTEKPSPQFCWQANLEALHRETLKRLRAEIEPLSLEEYSDFLLRWQHVHPSTRLRGKEGLIEALHLLEGYGTFPELWHRDILPIRVPDFDPVWLDGLIEECRLVFGRFCLKGFAGSEAGAATVLCRPASVAYLLMRNEPPNFTRKYPELLQFYDDCLDVYNRIAESDGATIAHVIESTGLEKARVGLALSGLYNGGLITNTSPKCLFGRTESNRGRLRVYGFQAEAGRWVTCASLQDAASPQPLDEPERVRRRVLQALRMFGIASVPVLVDHFQGLFYQRSQGLPPNIVRRACDELVGRGEAVKGIFVRDLEGEQYALPGVPEQTRRPADEDELMLMVSSLDPASLYISIIPVPSLNAYCFPRRFMLLDRGRLVAVVDQKSGSKRRFVMNNIHLTQGMEPEEVCRLIDAMADFLRCSGRFDALEVRGIDGRPAASDPIAEIFRHRGFEVSESGLRVSLDALRPWDPLSLPRIEMGGPSEEATDPIAAVQAVFEQVAGMPMVRQRGQGRTTLKLKGRLLVNCPDGKEPMFMSTSITQDQKDLFAAIPEAFKPYARIYKDRYASHVEVRVPLVTDIEGTAFRHLVEAWLENAKRLLQKVRRRSRRGE